jgi:hypothetical protein
MDPIDVTARNAGEFFIDKISDHKDKRKDV